MFGLINFLILPRVRKARQATLYLFEDVCNQPDPFHHVPFFEFVNKFLALEMNVKTFDRNSK